MVAEVVAGTLHTRPRAAKRHARASSVMGIEIGAPFGRGRGGPGGWVILFEPELYLGEDIVVPDIAGWRRETMSEGVDGAYFTQAPDRVCEVLPPSTRGFD
ncbi:MAG: Uma2 family endonuclease [Albidovulum sp.]|nr:Uma2 family endonuclease [Albidovulum sp.]